MPRPKPPEPLKPRFIRMSDRQNIVFKKLGGAEWLRELLDKKDPFPKQYYERIKNISENHLTNKN